MAVQVLSVLPSKEGVHGYLEGLINHLGQKTLEQQTGLGVQTGVGVHLNEVDLHVGVDHEVVAKHLKLVEDRTGAWRCFFFCVAWLSRPSPKCLEIWRRNFLPERQHGVVHSSLHFGHYVLAKVYVLGLLEVDFKVFEGNLVSRFVFAVVGVVLLNSIVGKVHVSVCEVTTRVFVTGCSQVALLVEVPTELSAINNLGKSKDPNVKLAHGCVLPVSASYQQRISDVSLEHPTLAFLAFLEERLCLLK